MKASAIGRACLYTGAIMRMKPSMVAARLRRPRKVPLMPPQLTRLPSIAIPAQDCDASYSSRFDIDALARDEFYLLNERHSVNLREWSVAEASHLWDFNLHYFEYCVPLAARYASEGDHDCLSQFKRLVLSWISACEYPCGDAWHPYTISLRLINWLICFDLFGDALASDSVFMERAYESMYRQYRHLLVNQEKHLLANHYLENLKTLVICSVLFNEDDALPIVEQCYLGQLEEQILPDGVHYERSIMYHKLVLEGLLRVELAYRSVGKPVPHIVSAKAIQMLDAMASIERGMGKTPFFNDSADGVAKESTRLIQACRDIYCCDPDDKKTSFPDSGFYKLYDGNAAIVFFAGEPGPSYMLGHAHCDILSFELSVDGKPLIVNSGTYAYQSNLRDYFRSTAAHNTATVDDEEQMECWAEHRVARGVSCVRIEKFTGRCLVASFRNYRGRLHRRSIEIKDGELIVTDSSDCASAEVTEYFHLSGKEVLEFLPFHNCTCECDENLYSAEFGELSMLPVIKDKGKGRARVVISLPVIKAEGSLRDE